MKLGDVIAGFICGLMVWLAVFIFCRAGGRRHLSYQLGGIAFVTALLLAVLAIALAGKIRKSAVIAGMMIALTIGILFCASFGV